MAMPAGESDRAEHMAPIRAVSGPAPAPVTGFPPPVIPTGDATEGGKFGTGPAITVSSVKDM
ncbi:hypothetical protein GCM10009818_35140 [Nakamurella flavida]